MQRCRPESRARGRTRQEFRSANPHWTATGSIRFASRNSTDRKSTRLNSSHSQISYAVFCLNNNNIRLVAILGVGDFLLEESFPDREHHDADFLNPVEVAVCLRLHLVRQRLEGLAAAVQVVC